MRPATTRFAKDGSLLKDGRRRRLEPEEYERHPDYAPTYLVERDRQTGDYHVRHNPRRREWRAGLPFVVAARQDDGAYELIIFQAEGKDEHKVMQGRHLVLDAAVHRARQLLTYLMNGIWLTRDDPFDLRKKNTAAEETTSSEADAMSARSASLLKASDKNRGAWAMYSSTRVEECKTLAPQSSSAPPLPCGAPPAAPAAPSAGAPAGEWLSIQNRCVAKGDCLVWTGSVDKRGNPATGHRHESVRRLVWRHLHGEPPPAGRQIRTTCGNKLCLQPHHLHVNSPAQTDAGSIKRELIRWSRGLPDKSPSEQAVRRLRRLLDQFARQHASERKLHLDLVDRAIGMSVRLEREAPVLGDMARTWRVRLLDRRGALRHELARQAASPARQSASDPAPVVPPTSSPVVAPDPAPVAPPPVHREEGPIGARLVHGLAAYRAQVAARHAELIRIGARSASRLVHDGEPDDDDDLMDDEDQRWGEAI